MTRDRCIANPALEGIMRPKYDRQDTSGTHESVDCRVSPYSVMPLAAVMTGPRQPLEVRDIPKPDLEPGAALLRTLYSEVCGTDVHLHHGRLDVPFPIIPGHVSVGVVDQMRGSLTDVSGNRIKEGDTVTFLDVHETCNHCYHCLVAKQ